MATQDRRTKLTIDEINEYWRLLKDGYERPSVHRVINAVRVLDVAVESSSSMNKKLSVNFWTRIRDDLFDILVTSFAGHFAVCDEEGGSTLEPGAFWPTGGVVEFYPEKTNRRDDACPGKISALHPAIALRMRWAFAEGRQNVSPDDFSNFKESLAHFDSNEQEEEAKRLLDQLYTTCAHEASKLKKIAHRKWWQLHHQSSTCEDRRQRGELRREMDELELVWGRSQ